MAKGRKGQILTLAILVMFVGAIILGGLFMYLDSSLSLTIKSEESAVNYYAADSGVEDAIAWLQHKPWSQSGELAGWPDCNPLSDQCANAYEINGRNVTVTVEAFGDNTYLINSTAKDNKNAKSITIESYVDVETLDLYEFGADAITSNCDCDTDNCRPPSDYSVEINGQKGDVLGNISYVCSLDCNPPSACTFNDSYSQEQYEDGIPWWPDTDDLLYYFWYMAQAAEDLPVDDDGNAQINVGDPSNTNIGPLYVAGNLEIRSSDSCESTPDECPRVTIEGIVYVAGDLTIGGAHPFTLNLSNQTIFAAGSIDVDGQTTLSGSGSIIALGDISFAPNMQSEESDFVFIMSVEGEVDLQPGGSFWGSVAAGGQVRVAPDNIVGHRDPALSGYVFPGIEPIFDIITYNITKFE